MKFEGYGVVDENDKPRGIWPHSTYEHANKSRDAYYAKGFHNYKIVAVYSGEAISTLPIHPVDTTINKA